MSIHGEQVEEIESLEAIYDGSPDIIIERGEELRDEAMQTARDSSLALTHESTLRVTCFQRAQPRAPFVVLRVWFPATYLANDADVSSPPSFELESSIVSVGRLSRFCAELDQLFDQQPQSPILFTWLEWLRTEAYDLVEECEVADPRAIKVWVETSSTQDEVAPELHVCANCEKAGPCLTLDACGHMLCSTCITFSIQIEAAHSVPHCCPLPRCRSQLSEREVASMVACPEPWMQVSRKLLGTSFQDSVVFCPRCEDRGMDIPIFVGDAAMRSLDPAFDGAADPHMGSCSCKCFSCGWRFCGICRSPCHYGSACFDDQQRVVRLAKRRPPLASELQDLAVRIAEDVKKSEAEKGKDLANAMRNSDFVAIQQMFLDAHEDAMIRGLESVFGQGVQVYPAPVSHAVTKRFMESYTQYPHTELRPAFHGTDARNHDSIFQRGLLIPGDSNELTVVHGKAHGRGVYTANIDAAWLSRGFATQPILLICGVLQTSSVRHVFDAMVVGESSHVVPLFVGEGPYPGGCSAPRQQTKVKVPSTSVPLAPDASVTKATNGATGKANVKPPGKSNKDAKFKARLTKLSNRH